MCFAIAPFTSMFIKLLYRLYVQFSEFTLAEFFFFSTCTPQEHTEGTETKRVWATFLEYLRDFFSHQEMCWGAQHQRQERWQE